MQFSPVSARLNGCQARNLAGLIALYESNYQRLLRLAPELEGLGDHVVSRVVGALDLHLSVVERFKYTMELVLTYRFAHDAGTLLEPNVVIRVYHDARVAEALRGTRRPHHRLSRCQRRSVPTELEEKWELNRFLQRWLGYCQRQGHLFLACDPCPSGKASCSGPLLTD